MELLFKGIVHQFFFYRSHLIYWIVMGCGIADFGRRGRPKLNIFGFSFCSHGPRLAAPQGTSTRAMGPWLKSMAPRVEVEVPCAAIRGPLRCESRSLVALRVEVPGDKIKTQKCWGLAVYRPLRTKSAIPHPITIQNMRFEQRKKKIGEQSL